MEPSNRKIISRSPSRTVRIINLPGLLQAPVAAESSLEADYVHRAALVPKTSTLLAQPFRLPISPKGYTPDYLQTFSNSTLKAVIEIKIERKLADYKSLFDSAAAFLRDKGYTFYVVTEKVLHCQNVDLRTKQILRYAKAVFPQPDCEHVEQLLAEYPEGLPMGTLRRKARISLELILHLIATKRISTGHRLLFDDSVVVKQAPKPGSCADNPLEEALGIKPWQSATQS
jgi:hypothetical protein